MAANRFCGRSGEFIEENGKCDCSVTVASILLRGTICQTRRCIFILPHLRRRRHSRAAGHYAVESGLDDQAMPYGVYEVCASKGKKRDFSLQISDFAEISEGIVLN
ncbi:hypothetical protein MA16_Dca008759 [Dendrobium catenatum]|uniref:Uncharacterized protein n=1 Tax=Dendrobium catenatum TaxID=906689 RepID=A0A2I0W4R5_9ASPA|nr:hypothetical protein MA16_Dca008759 [Dendrobium catenatum]